MNYRFFLYAFVFTVTFQFYCLKILLIMKFFTCIWQGFWQEFKDFLYLLPQIFSFMLYFPKFNKAPPFIINFFVLDMKFYRAQKGGVQLHSWVQLWSEGRGPKEAGSWREWVQTLNKTITYVIKWNIIWLHINCKLERISIPKKQKTVYQIKYLFQWNTIEKSESF